MSTETQPQAPSLLGKILAFIIGTGVLVLAFMFSLVALAVIAVVGLMVWGWLWWKTRAIRQQMREQGPLAPDFGAGSAGSGTSGRIIEGEVIVSEETPARPERLLR